MQFCCLYDYIAIAQTGKFLGCVQKRTEQAGIVKSILISVGSWAMNEKTK